MENTMEKRYLPVKNTAKLYSIDTKYIYKWIHEIPNLPWLFKVGEKETKNLIRLDVFDTWLKQYNSTEEIA